MEFNKLGRTGCELSIIGFGGERIDFKPYQDVKEVIYALLEHGINIIDIFMPGREIRENIAKALGRKRDNVMIQGSIGSIEVNRQYDISRDLPVVQRYFEDMLRIFGGYIDFGMLYFIDSEDDYKGIFETGVADYAMRLKKQGHIRHIGFSSHNPEMAMKVINTGIVEMMMFSINPAYDMLPLTEYPIDYIEKDFEPGVLRGLDPIRAELYKLCTQKQIGITAMKVLGVGKLISPEHTPFAQPMTTAQCIHYALSRPSVASVLMGCSTADEVRDAVSYLAKSDAQRDYTGVISAVQSDFKGSCVYCSHCLPCPKSIDIAAVHKYLDIAHLDLANVPPSIRSHYMSMPHTGEECIACGNCEKRCPFGVSIIENMKEAVRLFKK